MGRRALHQLRGGGSLKLVINRTLGDLETEASETVETTATNEHINDDGSAQKLTYIDIQQLKNSGISGREIIEQQLASSDSFANRTVYSQAKYVARKEQKHLKLFTPLQPDFGNVCDFWFDKSPEKIRYIRKDALSQCAELRQCQAWRTLPGRRRRVRAVWSDRVLERLGGDGMVMAINDAESPPAFDIVPYFTFHPKPPRTCSSDQLGSYRTRLRPVFSNQDITSTSNSRSVKDKARDRKRQAGFREVDRVRSDFFAGDFDAVLIACHYDPVSILSRLNRIWADRERRGSQSVSATAGRGEREDEGGRGVYQYQRNGAVVEEVSGVAREDASGDDDE